MSTVTLSPLGKASTYVSHYQRDLLFAIPRKLQRDGIGVSEKLPFVGKDIWNAYELSWLNAKGKPMVALGEFIFACESPNLIESKSFKLYLNSFNNTRFDSLEHVAEIMRRDLREESGADVVVNIIPLNQFSQKMVTGFAGISLDALDVDCNVLHVDANLLKTEQHVITETVCSDLLKSNCLVTGQPDWASVQITYTGNKIQHESLLKYIVSFRDHNEFHEQCVERIFVDIMQHCKPQKLYVRACYTRRGGLDINPYRASYAIELPENIRLCRQ
jgi:7-cyano-7-deazaguanine reductase